MAPHHHAPRRESGFTLIEAVVVVAIIAVLSVMIVQSIRGLASTQTYTRDQAKVLAVADRVIQDIARDVRFAVRAFIDVPEDVAFLDYLDIEAGTVPESNRLPITSDLGVFDEDPPGKPFTGNQLVLVTGLPSVEVDVGDAEPDVRRCDAFQFLSYYLCQRPDGLFDIGRWASQPLASYSDIESLDSEFERLAAGRDLAAIGVHLAWDSRAPAAEAFYVIDASTGALIPQSAPSRKPVKRDPELSVEYLLVNRRVEVAQNGAARVAVPKFAAPSENFPHGFEVRIDGPGAGKLVVVRLVLAVRHGENVTNSAEAIRVVSMRDS